MIFLKGFMTKEAETQAKTGDINGTQTSVCLRAETSEVLRYSVPGQCRKVREVPMMKIVQTWNSSPRLKTIGFLN